MSDIIDFQVSVPVYTLAIEGNEVKNTDFRIIGERRDASSKGWGAIKCG
jgi:hypothetical protein